MQLKTLLFCILVPILQVLSLPLNGADISSLPLLESQGIRYSDGGSVKPFETILAGHGFSLARIRVWTAGTYTQSYALSLAKRAKAAGMKILVDLHYSDTCKRLFYLRPWLQLADMCRAQGADPGHQAIPASWPTDLNGLNTQIYTLVSPHPSSSSQYLIKTLAIPSISSRHSPTRARPSITYRSATRSMTACCGRRVKLASRVSTPPRNCSTPLPPVFALGRPTRRSSFTLPTAGIRVTSATSGTAFLSPARSPPRMLISLDFLTTPSTVLELPSARSNRLLAQSCLR